MRNMRGAPTPAALPQLRPGARVITALGCAAPTANFGTRCTPTRQPARTQLPTPWPAPCSAGTSIHTALVLALAALWRTSSAGNPADRAAARAWQLRARAARGRAPTTARWCAPPHVAARASIYVLACRLSWSHRHALFAFAWPCLVSVVTPCCLTSAAKPDRGQIRVSPAPCSGTLPMQLHRCRAELDRAPSPPPCKLRSTADNTHRHLPPAFAAGACHWRLLPLPHCGWRGVWRWAGGKSMEPLPFHPCVRMFDRH